MDTKYEKNATVTMALKAKSGYRSTETHKVSAMQWAAMIGVAVGTIDAKEAMALLRPLDTETA